jgi:hypothetical protein
MSIFNLPGCATRLPVDTQWLCDSEQHEERPAVWLVQGETDSFGCEYLHLCNECRDAADEYERNLVVECEWCKTPSRVYPTRDLTESGGSVYSVCMPCIQKMRRAQIEEYEAMREEEVEDDYSPEVDDDPPWYDLTEEECLAHDAKLDRYYGISP